MRYQGIPWSFPYSFSKTFYRLQESRAYPGCDKVKKRFGYTAEKIPSDNKRFYNTEPVRYVACMQIFDNENQQDGCDNRRLEIDKKADKGNENNIFVHLFHLIKQKKTFL